MSILPPVLLRGESSSAIAIEYCGIMGRELESVELVLGMLCAIDEIKKLANEIVVDKAIFLRIAYFLVELRPCVDYLFQQQDFLRAHPSLPALQSLATSIDAIYTHARSWSKRSRIYLLYCCTYLVKEIHTIAKNLADSLKSLLEDTIAVPSDIRDQTMDLRSKLLEVKFFSDLNNEELARTISAGLAEGLSDEAYATSLLRKIATHLRMPLSTAAQLKMELQRDKESAELERREKDLQVLKDLYKLVENGAVLADVRKLASEDSTVRRRSSLTPPSSFFCPITGQVMQDPVVVEGGFTYEKSAILEWFERGHRTCPDTGVELVSLELIPNLNLRQAMDEFFDRMSKEQLTSAIEKIRGQATPSELKAAIETIQELIDHNPNYKRYVVSLDGVEPLVAILKPSAAEVKGKILRLLCGIAALGDEYKAGRNVSEGGN
ncbi:hypothetical protein O6H91_Y558100 [Diphasiastrum complanatum]|nr:hypothetical protein O6H91_Y558100 [Diphasiastrum complanatum]